MRATIQTGTPRLFLSTLIVLPSRHSLLLALLLLARCVSHAHPSLPPLQQQGMVLNIVRCIVECDK